MGVAPCPLFQEKESITDSTQDSTKLFSNEEGTKTVYEHSQQLLPDTVFNQIRFSPPGKQINLKGAPQQEELKAKSIFSPLQNMTFSILKRKNIFQVSK